MWLLSSRSGQFERVNGRAAEVFATVRPRPPARSLMRLEVVVIVVVIGLVIAVLTRSVHRLRLVLSHHTTAAIVGVVEEACFTQVLVVVGTVEHPDVMNSVRIRRLR